MHIVLDKGGVALECINHMLGCIVVEPFDREIFIEKGAMSCQKTLDDRNITILASQDPIGKAFKILPHGSLVIPSDMIGSILELVSENPF
jgi:hypothetical protein